MLSRETNSKLTGKIKNTYAQEFLYNIGEYLNKDSDEMLGEG
jgi:hypothetical protein